MTLLTPLPTPPSSSDPTNFNTRADAFLLALPTMVTQLNSSILGGQIPFPSTQVSSSDPNTLDDYEEGTWTPIITASTPPTGASAVTAHGDYIKIGKMVFAAFELATITLGSGGAGNTMVTGLPFVGTGMTTSVVPQQCSVALITLSAGYTQFVFIVQTALGQVILTQNGTNINGIAIPWSNMNASAIIRGTLVYQTAN